jgi:hypothetical protein
MVQFVAGETVVALAEWSPKTTRPAAASSTKSATGMKRMNELLPKRSITFDS